MPFRTDLHLLALRDADEYQLLQPLIYETRAGDFILVPAGFRTDFASVPRGFWNLFPRDGRGRDAAVVHDWLYEQQDSLFTRAQADTIFREALAELGVSGWRRWIMWAAVRLGGRRFWK
jgi:hypothetical protein